MKLWIAAVGMMAVIAAGNARAQAPAAGDVKLQLKTAITHAGFAANGNAAGYVRQHLGHALNCLEGAKGAHFNQAWGNVCQGQGSGIVVDLKSSAGGPDFVLLADQAQALALAGVRSNSLNEARHAARGVTALLTVIVDNLK
jgi:hypothetical protein